MDVNVVVVVGANWPDEANKLRFLGKLRMSSQKLTNIIFDLTARNT